MTWPDGLKYRAFISYSHKDARWARWLHFRLENFRIGKTVPGENSWHKGAPLRPVFLDRDEFLAGEVLTKQTIKTIDDSAALIVVCSNNAAKSWYVNEEVRLFKARHRERPVIPIVIDGCLEHGAGGFPSALSAKGNADGIVTADIDPIIAADARPQADGKDLALAKVIARLLGVGTDDVFKRIERQKRLRTLVRLAISAILFAALITAGVTFWSDIQHVQTLKQIKSILRKHVPLDDAYFERSESLLEVITAMAAEEDPRFPHALDLLAEGKSKEAEKLYQAIAVKSTKNVATAYRYLGTIAGLSDPKSAREY